jgi:DNA-binding transcriptional LysR family regulator
LASGGLSAKQLGRLDDASAEIERGLVLDLRKLRHVVAVAHYGGFAKAALALNITQSALTKNVQHVEGRLGMTLLERGPRGVRVTDEGQWFLERSGRIIADLAQLESDGGAFRTLQKGLLRIGIAPAALDAVVTDVIAQFASRWPSIRLQITTDSVSNINRLLLSGDVEMAVGALDSLKADPSVEVSHLFVAPVDLFVRRGHPLDLEEMPPLRALFAYPMVSPTAPEPYRTQIRGLAKTLDSPFDQPHFVTDSFALTRRIVESTDAFSVVVAEQARTPVFQRHFRSWSSRDALPPLAIDLAFRAGWQETPAVREMIKLLRERSLRLGPPCRDCHER